MLVVAVCEKKEGEGGGRRRREGVIDVSLDGVHVVQDPGHGMPLAHETVFSPSCSLFRIRMSLDSTLGRVRTFPTI
jgi:hypothetical protein